MTQRRFVRRGTAKYHFLPAILAPATGPTEAEMEAGEDITAWIAAVTGFTKTSTTIPTPDMGSRHESSIPGLTQADDSSFRFYDDLDSDEIDTLFPPDTEGFIVIDRKGPGVGKPRETWPVRVSSFAPNHTVDMNAADLTVSFSITSEPWTEQTIAAA